MKRRYRRRCCGPEKKVQAKLCRCSLVLMSTRRYARICSKQSEMNNNNTKCHNIMPRRAWCVKRDNHGCFSVRLAKTETPSFKSTAIVLVVYVVCCEKLYQRCFRVASVRVRHAGAPCWEPGTCLRLGAFSRSASAWSGSIGRTRITTAVVLMAFCYLRHRQ